MLRDLKLKPSYFKTRNELYNDFYKPIMEESSEYFRITGYFGSSVLLVLNESIKDYVLKRGKIKIVCSPNLTDEDINSIFQGYEDKTDLKVNDLFSQILDELDKNYPNTTKLLSNLISTDIIEIKIAIFNKSSDNFRLMHDKAGLFVDGSGDFVAFRGSINETFKGLSEFGNSESFDVYTSWEENKDKERAQSVGDQFKKIWAGTEPNIKTYDLSKTTKIKILELRGEKNLNELFEEVRVEQQFLNKKWFAEVGSNSRKIRTHQSKALNNWDKNNRRGIFQMCTGSGKTFAALCAIRESLQEKNEVPIILVPSKLLFNQWLKEINNVFGSNVEILKIGNFSNANSSTLSAFSDTNIKQKRIIISTYQSASKPKFLESVRWGDHIFLVCDEVHNIGTKQNIKILEKETGPRLGLSATPKRYFDEDGTQKIINYFDKVIEPKYEIVDAIKDGVLTEYYYDINEVKLTSDEQQGWDDLTKKINKLAAIKGNLEDNKLSFENLLFKRADIIKKATNKLYIAEEILNKNYIKGQKWLVYLDDFDHLNKLKERLSYFQKFDNQILEYHTQSESNLEKTLDYFTNHGGVLLSINCLDEGVDIPSIEYAIILSSSKNPRQYIQRRGRVLRVSKNKPYAYIYDCLVTANDSEKDIIKNLSIIKGEISRSIEFARNAKFPNLAMSKIKLIMIDNDISEAEGGFDQNEWFEIY